MNSNSLIEKYKYYKIQNNLLRKQRIKNKDIPPKIEMNIPIKSNNFEYFPIESDKSKAGGHTIYLVTEESIYNNENEKNDFTQTTDEINPIQMEKVQNPNNNGDFLEQKSIEIQINNSKINNQIVSKNKNNSIKNHKHNPSENENYEINSIYNNNKKQNMIYKIQNNNLNINNNTNIDNNPINLEIFNEENTREINEENENVNKYNNYKIFTGNSKTPMYRKKIKFTKNEEINKNINNINSINNNKDILINNTKNENNTKTKSKIFKKLQKNRNIIKEEKDNLKKEEKLSLTEIKKEDNIKNIDITENNCLSNENSLHDAFTSKNLGLLNRSLDEISLNIDSLYKSLDFVQNNMLQDLNNSKIMGKNFLDGMKNPERKKSLKIAMARYNRFKSLGKLEKKKITKLDDSPKSPNLGNGIAFNIEKKENKKEEKKIEEKIEYDAKVKEFDNEEKREENKISDVEENENEFSFNSELKKYEKKNNLENKTKEENNTNKDMKENENLNNNGEIEDKKNEIINEGISNNYNNINDDINNNDIVKNGTETVLSQEVIINEEKKEKDKDFVQGKNIFIKEIIKNKNENAKKFIKQEINSSKDSSIDKKQEEIILNKNENNSGNNIINNSINININNESLNNDKIKNQNKYIPINNIKYKTHIKPGFFIRKVVREEHYYVDENGKEKILQVKHEYINNEDTKKMKTKHPYKKKYINMGSYLNANENNTSLDSTLLKEKYNDDIKMENNLNKDNNNIFKNNESFDEKIIRKEKIEQNRPKPQLTMTKKNLAFNNFNLNENLFNGNNSNANDNNYRKNIIYNQFKTQVNNNGYKVDYNNTIKENRNAFNLNENKIVNKRSIQKIEPNPIKSSIKNEKEKEKENPIIINRSKYLENKTRLIKPTLRKEYFNNAQYYTKVLNNNNLTLQLNSNTLGNTDNIEEKVSNLNTLNNIDSYIKVNKVDKFKHTKTQQNLNNIRKYNNIINTNANYINNRKKRESSKYHAYREINLTNINKEKIKLRSNSLSHFYPSETNDELNTSNNTNKYSITTNTSDKNNIIKYSTNSFNKNSKKYIELNNNYKEKNFSNKSSSSSLFMIYRLTNKFNRNDVIQNDLNTSNRENHRYYESKSTKKDKNFNKIYGDYNKNQYNYKEFQRNNLESLNNKDKKEKYFYSYFDFKNSNNYNTEKKFKRTAQYYN